MEYLVFILFFAVVLPAILMVIIGILNVVSRFQQKNLLTQIISENNITNYTSSNQFADGSYIMVDHDKEHIWVVSDGNSFYTPFDDIREVKLEIDDTVAFNTSLASAAGRVIVGGALFGGVGAVVGGVTAKKLGKKKVNRVILRISFSRNCNIPFFQFTLLNNQEGVRTDDYRYENAEKDGVYWSEYITSLID